MTFLSVDPSGVTRGKGTNPKAEEGRLPGVTNPAKLRRRNTIMSARRPESPGREVEDCRS